MRQVTCGYVWHSLAATPSEAVNVCCTFTAYATMAGQQPSLSPFFQQVTHNELNGKAATYKQMLAAFRADLKVACPAKEMQEYRYGLHSFRRGRATAARAAGVPDAFTYQYGGWSSEAYQLYTEIDGADREAISRARFTLSS